MSIKKLPSMEHVFTVDLKGSGTKQIYSGTFKYKRPTIKVKSDISKTKALLDGGLDLDADMSFLHKVLATLRHTLIEHPQWWVQADYGFELDESDVNVILDIYRECNEFEKSWFDEVWADKSEKPEESEQKTTKA